MTDLPPLQPFDTFNQTLQANVSPADWVNPVPKGVYHLVVIGAGTAGLVTAAAAAGLGARVALVERALMGGDCLNVGCVPSKALLSAARMAEAVRRSPDFGVVLTDEPRVDFAKVMQRMRQLRAEISPHDSAERFSKLGVDVFFGDARFVDNSTVSVGDQQLKFRKAVICTGARAALLPIPGLEDAGPLTNENLFSLTELPARMAVIGAGPIGCEMAQAFARFGSRVTLLEAADRVLFREDPDASAIVQSALMRDGVELNLKCRIEEVRKTESGEIVVRLQDSAGQARDVIADHVLVAAGRIPNVESLDLDRAGVRFDLRTGVEVDDHLRTSNPRIFAAGDVCSKFKFTHAADFMARIVIQNALFAGRARASALTIPWCTYTSPELAHVGVTAEQAAADGIAIDTYTIFLKDVDRAVLDGVTDGFVRAHVRKGTDEIVGATIVADHAGDLIGEFSLAMTASSRVSAWKKLLRLQKPVGLATIGRAIHPYPTQAEAIRRLGDLYQRSRLTPFTRKLIGMWLRWMV